MSSYVAVPFIMLLFCEQGVYCKVRSSGCHLQIWNWRHKLGTYRIDINMVSDSWKHRKSINHVLVKFYYCVKTKVIHSLGWQVRSYMYIYSISLQCKHWRTTCSVCDKTHTWVVLTLLSVDFPSWSLSNSRCTTTCTRMSLLKSLPLEVMWLYIIDGFQHVPV